MRRSPQHRLAMVQTTVAYLAKTEFVWKSNPAFVKAVTDLEKALASILVDHHPSPKIGEDLASKAHARELLEDLTSEIADQLYALSQETGEVTLATASDISRASLDQLSDDELEHTALEITHLAEKHLGALADYLVVSADVAELTTLIHRHVTGESDPMWAEFDSTQVQDGLRTADKILRGRLDKLVARYRTSEPEFVAGYHRARLLVDLHGRARLGSVWMNRAAAETPAEFSST